MYGKGGVDVVKIGEIKVSVQKLCLKQGFFEDTNLDHLTSGWPGAHCFRGDANFDMFPKKYAIQGWKAMDLSFNLAPSYRDLKDPTSRQNFEDTVEQKRVIDLRPCHSRLSGCSRLPR